MKEYRTLLCEQHIMLFDTTVGTFLGPPFEDFSSHATKGWSEEGTDSGIEESHILLAQQGSGLFHITV
jgi:hypothetical protein